MKKNLFFLSILPAILLLPSCSMEYADFNSDVFNNSKLDDIKDLKEKYDKCEGTIKYSYEATDSSNTSSNVKFDFTYDIVCGNFYEKVTFQVINPAKNYDNKQLVDLNYFKNNVFHRKEKNTLNLRFAFEQGTDFQTCTQNYYSSTGLYCYNLSSYETDVVFYGWFIKNESNNYTSRVNEHLSSSIPRDVKTLDNGFNKVTVSKFFGEYRIQVKANTGSEAYEYRYNEYGCLTYYNYSFKSEESLLGSTRVVTKKETFKANYTTKK